MNEQSQILFMQIRLLRLASHRWNTSVQSAARVFDKYEIFMFIEECFDVFHMEGDCAVFEEIAAVLRNKGVDVNAEVK